jgi:hypothetical protein
VRKRPFAHGRRLLRVDDGATFAPQLARYLATLDLQGRSGSMPGRSGTGTALVVPTSVGMPVERRSLNRHLAGIRTAPACAVSDCTTSGTPA